MGWAACFGEVRHGLPQSGCTKSTTAFERNILKGCVALIDPKLILPAIIGDKNIDKMIVIEVRAHNSHSCSESRIDTSFFRHIAERTITVVTIKNSRHR